ncbi:MAG: SIMPL domain-containing protein, partial [Bacteroidota bacterium]
MNTDGLWSVWYIRLLVVLALIGLVLALGAYAYTTWESRHGTLGPTTINVRGEGEVLAKPDIGQFSFAVRAEGADAAAAQDASATAINAIIGYLSEAGVIEADIKTRNYNLNPSYTYEERACEAGFYCPPGDRVIDGYEVYQNVEVKVRDLDNAGALISGVGERGATNISSLQFTIDEEDTLKAEARAAAIADAKAKAKVLAKDLDVRLVRLLGYWEDEGGYYPEPYFAESALDTRALGAAVPSLPTGENTISAAVTLKFEIK